ncbi:jg14299 [Pararge aegeria aegeria]|uniref:Jg14299 protein n=1 Tax=Pararge aegeria aegeria TaxID=348720 RepID=A0A8S4R4Q4_9NEOP|nr:jg14299 [Pararge aegeria aegeria]
MHKHHVAEFPSKHNFYIQNLNAKKKLEHGIRLNGSHYPRLTPEGAVAKARYYGLASGGANQLPAAARAFTPLPLPYRHPSPHLSLARSESPVLYRQPNARNANECVGFLLHVCEIMLRVRTSLL